MNSDLQAILRTTLGAIFTKTILSKTTTNEQANIRHAIAIGLSKAASLPARGKPASLPASQPYTTVWSNRKLTPELAKLECERARFA